MKNTVLTGNISVLIISFYANKFKKVIMYFQLILLNYFNKRNQKKVYLSLIISFLIIIFLLSSNNCLAKQFDEKLKINNLIDIDGTLITRVNPNYATVINNIKNKGYEPYKLKFKCSKLDNIKFFNWYASISKKKNNNNFEDRIIVNQLDNNTLEINEVIILRPIFQSFLEKIDALNSDKITVKLFIASRNDDIRNQNIIDNLRITINGEKFNEKVKLIPRSYFRIHLYSDNELIAGKSAALVRSKFNIKNADYIVFIDNIHPQRFIVGDKKLDKLLIPTRFTIKNLNKNDIEQDRKQFDKFYKEILNFIHD